MEEIKIFINGESGKMGSSIAKLIDDNKNFAKVKQDDFLSANIVIDFSHPNSTAKIVNDCLIHRKPLIIGTTGLKEDIIEKIKKASKTIPIVMGSNMSKGIIDLKKSLQNYIKNNSDSINCIIEETHHTEKIDAPSGTAIELRDYIISLDVNKKIQFIEITSNRIGNVFGIHKVSFIKKDSIKEFKHEALTRDVFAYGALYAAKKIFFLDPSLDSSIYRFEDI
ncbi:MAG: 4-hydroxy-tetrahydrodipicolinate reductase [Gammaproteobacteria bacterium]|nr:4-hydroxy-tetrahydrodipicolinate reductase [Gammaproteobacteria bacterium]|tara:strand:+ start:5591 stop:6259 length:669 start_codon:yes stop_codon:yes gene_type:complete